MEKKQQRFAQTTIGGNSIEEGTQDEFSLKTFQAPLTHMKASLAQQLNNLSEILIMSLTKQEKQFKIASKLEHVGSIFVFYLSRWQFKSDLANHNNSTQVYDDIMLSSETTCLIDIR